jgi:hypothetical protein
MCLLVIVQILSGRENELQLRGRSGLRQGGLFMRVSRTTFEQVSEMTVPELFERRVAENPEDLAVCSVRGELSFGGWAAQAASAARRLD